jgi:hypothetical protein
LVKENFFWEKSLFVFLFKDYSKSG